MWIIDPWPPTTYGRWGAITRIRMILPLPGNFVSLSSISYLQMLLSLSINYPNNNVAIIKKHCIPHYTPTDCKTYWKVGYFLATFIELKIQGLDIGFALLWVSWKLNKSVGGLPDLYFHPKKERLSAVRKTFFSGSIFFSTAKSFFSTAKPSGYA